MSDPWDERERGSEPPTGEQGRLRFDREAWEALGLGGALGGEGGAAGEGAWPTGDHEPRCVELCPICRTADVLRAAGPPELRGQLHELQREALLTLRAVLDHYLERLDREPAAGDRVEQIPIE